ncbi:MAG: hypothetical protein AB8B74_01550 [Crocinitomicaceae bacterium]
MKIKIVLTVVLAVSLGLTSCKKRGDFTTDKEEYAQGEVITVTNTTVKESEFYKWDFGGVEVIDKNPIYTLPENTPVGSFTINVLPVNSLNTTGNWKEYSRTVNIVEAEKAKIIFFLSKSALSGSNETWTVETTVRDETVSKTLSDISSFAPNCESNNNLDAITFDNLPSGDYLFTIKGTSSTSNIIYNDAVNLENGFDCRIIDLAD